MDDRNLMGTADLTLQGVWSARSAIYRNNFQCRARMWGDADAHQYFNRLHTGWENTDYNHIVHTMGNIMQEIDTRYNGKLSSRPRHFLDIGAASGGFSTYFLNQNQATHRHSGVGITLPENQGGHKMLLGDTDVYHVHYTDVTQDPLTYDIRDVRQPFNLILCDAARLGGVQGETDMKAWMNAHQRLTIAQLLIAFRHLDPGGELIVKVSCKTQAFSASVLLLLFRLFGTRVTLIKPRQAHRCRSSFYIVCSGFPRAEYDRDWKQALEDAWLHVRNDRHCILDSVASSKINVLSLESTYTLVRLLEPIWAFQSKAISAKLTDMRKKLARRRRTKWRPQNATQRGHSNNK